MTVQARFAFDTNVFDLLSHGWHIQKDFTPPAMNYQPIIASGVPSADYAGGELVDEFVKDVWFSLPLLYTGSAPHIARRALESFLRRSAGTKRLTLQLRQDRAFTTVPLWGQWGAWQTYEIIHAGSLTGDGRIWNGDERDYSYLTLPLTCKPAVTGQEQQVANAKGDVTESFGADGLSDGVIIANDDASQMVLPAAAVTVALGTIVIAWTRGAETLGAESFFFNLNDGIRLYWRTADGGKLALETYDAEGPESVTATLPAEGETTIFHLTFESGGTFDLYQDGAVLNNMAYTAGSADVVYVGTDSAGANGTGGTYRMFATYAAAMSAGEIAADYADIVAALAAGPSPSPIPYAVTLAGAGQIDNATDASGSTGAPHQNYAWLAGMPGSLPAKMELRLAPSVIGSACKRLAVSLLDYDDKFAPETGGVLYEDVGGTGNAGSSSGEYFSTTVDTTFGLQLDTDQADAVYRRLQGRELAMYARLQSGATGAFQIKLAVIVGSTIISSAKNVTTAAAFRLVRTPFLAMPQQAAPEIADAAESSVQLYAGRSTGSGTALFDWGMVMTRPLVEVDTSAVGALTVVIYENTANRAGGSGTVWANLPRKGDVLRPLPHRYNLLTLVMGDETVDPLVTWYATATITVTPRWSVI